jgi:hypothetical protein
MDLFFTILIFLGAIVLAAVLFVGWVVVTIVRAVMGAVLLVFRPRGRAARVATAQSVRCPRRQCRAENPRGARFCRRCGRLLGNNDEGGRTKDQRMTLVHPPSLVAQASPTEGWVR